MTMRLKSLARALQQMAVEAGASEVRIVRRRRHPAITFVLAGKIHVHAFPGTPSCRRSEANNRAAFRRRLRALNVFTGQVQPGRGCDTIDADCADWSFRCRSSC